MYRFPGKGLYVITDCNSDDFTFCLDKTREILDCGIAVIQYRDKTPDKDLRYERCAVLQEICSHYNTCFIVNDDIQMAETLGIHAVHIGRDDPAFSEATGILGPDACIGVSCYNDMNRAIAAQESGAAYIAFGAFFKTQTKQQTVTAPVELLNKARMNLTIPVVAIGGITTENGARLLDAGADMLAVISSVYNSNNTAAVVNTYNRLFD